MLPRNTAESFFALLKRGVYGTFHNVSRKHLHRYSDEFSFRWNGRKLTDGERTELALGMSTGKRLKYRGLINPRKPVTVKMDRFAITIRPGVSEEGMLRVHDAMQQVI